MIYQSSTTLLSLSECAKQWPAFYVHVTVHYHNLFGTSAHVKQFLPDPINNTTESVTESIFLVLPYFIYVLFFMRIGFTETFS